MYTDRTPKRVLVTGGCGYLGASLIRLLSQRPKLDSITIRILDNMQSRNYQALTNLPANGNYEFIEGDILDYATVRAALRDVDVVIHLAAIVRTAMSFDNPAWLGQVNNWGTAHLVEASIDAGVRRFLFASSSSVYGPGHAPDETAICRPVGPYAQSKRNGEMAVLAAMERGLDATILRLGTLYGHSPSTRFDAFVNRLVYLATTGRALTVYGTGQQTRPIVHVDDAALAMIFCLEAESCTGGQIYNVLESNPSVLDVIDIIKAIVPAIRVRYTDQDAMLSHFSFSCGNHKVQDAGWQPHISFSVGLNDLAKRFVNLTSGLPILYYDELGDSPLP